MDGISGFACGLEGGCCLNHSYSRKYTSSSSSVAVSLPELEIFATSVWLNVAVVVSVDAVSLLLSETSYYDSLGETVVSSTKVILSKW